MAVRPRGGGGTPVTRLGWVVLVVLSLAAVAWADGIVVPSQAAVKPARTPDQRALLRYDNGIETLVIETTVEGDGRDFAWIVPLPAAPKIEESTAGLFPTLDALCGPRVDTQDHHVWALIAIAGLIRSCVPRTSSASCWPPP